ncbi:hypothetical protein ACJMK2_008021 [Sinanodonta woodiana]|uniref:Uncharacterized protein n=1 Tax=Sinanodonta woodiana TaxID=1069815 RepID=A0ABD3VLH3_SINWO
MDSNKDSRTLNVQTAIVIFYQSTSETTDEYYLINKFAEIANLDPSSIIKRFPSGKLYEEELSSCKQACTNLATELSQFKQQIDLKLSHPQELETQSKFLKSKTQQLSSRIKRLINDKDKILQKFHLVVKETRSLSQYAVKLASVANNRSLQKTIIRQNQKLPMLKTDNEYLRLCNISLTVQLQLNQENVIMLTEKLTASKTASALESKGNVQLKRDLQNITEERDYLQALLQDNVVVDLFDHVSKCVTPDTRQCYNVASANVGPVTTGVLKFPTELLMKFHQGELLTI